MRAPAAADDPPGRAPQMHRVFLGRQAIFDRQLRVCAHELLFRAGPTATAGDADALQATAQVIVNAFVEFDLQRLIGPHRAFINVDRAFLLDARPVPLPHHRVVLEILETTVVDDEVVRAVQGLRDAGFGIALDDYVFDPAWDPLVPLAHVIKVDVQALSIDEIAAAIGRFGPHGPELLAEKVETHEAYEALRALGFHYFQGYFFERPQLVQGRQVPVERQRAVRLLAELAQPEPDLRRLERLIAEDANLSHKLLRSVNSAMFALPHRVTSLREAVRLVGSSTIARWASVVTLGTLSNEASPLLPVALVRASTCERLGRAAGYCDADTFFTVGLLSTLDALLGVEMPRALDDLPLADEIVEALLARRGPLGDALECAIACERWEIDGLGFATLDAAAVNAAFADALLWASGADSVACAA